MNNVDFVKLLYERIDMTHATLNAKGKEYASEDDILHNFKRAGAMQNVTPAKALVGMWAKHIISVLDIVDSGLIPDEKTINEKIGDSINYLIILEAIFKENR